MTQIALCPRCPEPTPLISTLAFTGFEFYCLECGQPCAFLEPRGATPTPELDARHAELRAEWDEHAGAKLLTPGAWHRDCERCAPRAREDPHIAHATEEEMAAHTAAVAWLQERSR